MINDSSVKMVVVIWIWNVRFQSNIHLNPCKNNHSNKQKNFYGEMKIEWNKANQIFFFWSLFYTLYVAPSRIIYSKAIADTESTSVGFSFYSLWKVSSFYHFYKSKRENTIQHYVSTDVGSMFVLTNCIGY